MREDPDHVRAADDRRISSRTCHQAHEHPAFPNCGPLASIRGLTAVHASVGKRRQPGGCDQRLPAPMRVRSAGQPLLCVRDAQRSGRPIRKGQRHLTSARGRPAVRRHDLLRTLRLDRTRPAGYDRWRRREGTGHGDHRRRVVVGTGAVVVVVAGHRGHDEEGCSRPQCANRRSHWRKRTPPIPTAAGRSIAPSRPVNVPVPVPPARNRQPSEAQSAWPHRGAHRRPTASRAISGTGTGTGTFTGRGGGPRGSPGEARLPRRALC